MDKNKKLLYCILGSAILALLKNPIFEHSRLTMFLGGYVGYILGELIAFLTKILSLVGFILLAIFSSKLIIRNIDLKDK